MGAIDADGLAVSYIQSLYWEYGSGCVLARTGVLDAESRPRVLARPGRAQALKPGRRPFHTLNPPLAVFDDGRVMSYGSMGGDGQPQFQAQVFTRIAAGASLADAVAAPRHLWGRTWGEASVSVKVEAGYDDAIAGALARAGHEIEWRAPKDCDCSATPARWCEPEGRDRRDPRSALGRRAGRIVSFGLSRSPPCESETALRCAGGSGSRCRKNPPFLWIRTECMLVQPS